MPTENTAGKMIRRDAGFMLLQRVSPGRAHRQAATEFDVRVGADGGLAVAVYAEDSRDAGTRSTPIAVVPFGRGDDAGDALAALLAAVYATDGQEEDDQPDPAGVADQAAGDGQANMVTFARLMTALPDEELPGVMDALAARGAADRAS